MALIGDSSLRRCILAGLNSVKKINFYLNFIKIQYHKHKSSITNRLEALYR